MTTDQLTDVLISRLLREYGGTKHEWRRRVGTVRLYSLKTHPHCNWEIYPTGSHTDILRIERALDELRLVHPLLANPS